MNNTTHAENCNVTVNGESYYNKNAGKDLVGVFSGVSTLIVTSIIISCISYSLFNTDSKGIMYWICLLLLVSCVFLCLRNLYTTYSDINDMKVGSEDNTRPCWSETKHVLYK